MLARGNLERLANLDNQASASSIAALQMLDRCCSLHHLLRWRQCEAVIIFLAVGYYLIAQFDQDAKFSTGDCPASADTSESILPEKYLPIQNPDGDFISVAMAQELLAANYIHANETSVRDQSERARSKKPTSLVRHVHALVSRCFDLFGTSRVFRATKEQRERQTYRFATPATALRLLCAARFLCAGQSSQRPRSLVCIRVPVKAKVDHKPPPDDGPGNALQVHS